METSCHLETRREPARNLGGGRAFQFHTALGDVKSWAGRFDLPGEQAMSPGDYCLLQENGLSGMIAFSKFFPEVHFVGQGPLGNEEVSGGSKPES
jgi:hypothetical protein